MDFLGVAQSITGRRWVGPGVEIERAGEAMAQQTGLPGPVCAVLARRGIAVEAIVRRRWDERRAAA